MHPTSLSGALIGGHTRSQLASGQRLFPAAGRRVMLIAGTDCVGANASSPLSVPVCT